jgi:hypothetical protein
VTLSELEQVSSQLSCKEESCIFFATTCFCLLTVLLIFMLPGRGHPVARAKEIATVSLRVFRHLLCVLVAPFPVSFVFL